MGQWVAYSSTADASNRKTAGQVFLTFRAVYLKLVHEPKHVLFNRISLLLIDVHSYPGHNIFKLVTFLWL